MFFCLGANHGQTDGRYENKTNHPISNRSHPSATANTSTRCPLVDLSGKDIETNREGPNEVLSPVVSPFLNGISICNNISMKYLSWKLWISTLQCSEGDIRGLFKKFCYERPTVHRKRICFSNFMYTYLSDIHMWNSKESRKYQHCYWHSK